VLEGLLIQAKNSTKGLPTGALTPVAIVCVLLFGACSRYHKNGIAITIGTSFCVFEECGGHSMQNMKTTLTGAPGLFGLAVSIDATAQEEPTTQQPPEEVVTTGIRGSLRRLDNPH
jgi:hypothetical protein